MEILVILSHQEHGEIGYAALDVAGRAINDLAVLPGFRMRSAGKLIEAVMDKVTQEGGDWTADARESTSYKLLQNLEKKGVIEFVDKPAITRYMGEKQEPVYHVVFRKKASVKEIPAVETAEDNK
jgi:hypothetical protein